MEINAMEYKHDHVHDFLLKKILVIIISLVIS